MTYRVKIKNTNLSKTIKARTELEAKAKYCEERGFDYRVFANKLEAEKRTGAKKR